LHRRAREADANERAEAARQARLQADREQWEAANRENEERAAKLDAQFKQLQDERDKYAQIAANEAAEKEKLAFELQDLATARSMFNEAERDRQLAAADALEAERAKLNNARVDLENISRLEQDRLANAAWAEQERLASDAAATKQALEDQYKLLTEDRQRTAHAQYAKEMELLHVHQQNVFERDSEVARLQAAQQGLFQETAMVQNDLLFQTGAMRQERVGLEGDRHSVIRDAGALRADAARLRSEADALRHSYASVQPTYASVPPTYASIPAPAAYTSFSVAPSATYYPSLAPSLAPSIGPSAAPYLAPRYWATLGSTPQYI